MFRGEKVVSLRLQVATGIGIGSLSYDLRGFYNNFENWQYVDIISEPDYRGCSKFLAILLRESPTGTKDKFNSHHFNHSLYSHKNSQSPEGDSTKQWLSTNHSYMDIKGLIFCVTSLLIVLYFYNKNTLQTVNM
jgi:hypothetical protein